MAANFEQWKKQTLGQKIDLDNQSFDCVDVSKSWGEFGSGKGWQTSCGWGNAKDIYSFWSNTYWEKLPRGNVPKVGDVVVMNGTVGGGYGHTGVVVEVIGNDIVIYQQNTFTQQAVYTGRFSWNASYITGFLRPKFAFEVGAAPVLAGNQRVVGGDNLFYRQAPNRGAELMITNTITDGKLKPGETYDFKGFVHGESVDGNDVWFVGQYSGGYAWSGGFTDTGTHDLPDLTPVQTNPRERQVGADAMNFRRTPMVDTVNNNVIRLIAPGTKLEMSAWTRGMAVDGNNIWFKHQEGYIWSGGFADSGTHDLPEETNTTTPPTPTVPTYPTPTNDPQVTAVYNKKHPLPTGYAPTDLVAVGNGQTLRKEAADSMALMVKQGLADSGTTFGMGSGYRSYATQETLYNNYVKQDGQEAADRYSARPGYSEHQTGLTMDFTPIDESFENGASWKWLRANAHKYGWVLRYPSDKEAVTGYMYEPWHWRYVGVDVAKDMNAKSITTLEEYFKVEGGGYPTNIPTPDPDPNPTPEPEPEKPVDPDNDAKAEAAKLLGRQGLLAAISALIAAVGDWAVMQLVGFNLPKEISIALAGTVYAALLYVDKWIHENGKIKLKGLIPF